MSRLTRRVLLRGLAAVSLWGMAPRLCAEDTIGASDRLVEKPLTAEELFLQKFAKEVAKCYEDSLMLKLKR